MPTTISTASVRSYTNNAEFDITAGKMRSGYGPEVLRFEFVTFDEGSQRDRVRITAADDHRSTVRVAFFDVLGQFLLERRSPRFSLLVDLLWLIFRRFAT